MKKENCSKSTTIETIQVHIQMLEKYIISTKTTWNVDETDSYVIKCREKIEELKSRLDNVIFHTEFSCP